MLNRIVGCVIAGLLVAQLAACVSTVEVVKDTPRDMEELAEQKIVAVLTNEGEAVRFDEVVQAEVVEVPERGEYAVIRATVEGEPYEINVDQVEMITVQKQVTTSCPLVYSWNGSEYVLDAEPIAGATTRGLERSDYSELEHLVPDGTTYRLQMKNLLEESQYLDLVELHVVDHPPDKRVIVDHSGSFHTVTKPVAPVAAQDQLGNDVRPWLVAKDKAIWAPPPKQDADGNVRYELTLSYAKPADATTMKLVANVGTAPWGANMVREMLALRGRDLESWYWQVDYVPLIPDMVRAWNLREELYVLKVYVEEPSGWQQRGVLHGAGPFVVEDEVVPLNVSRVSGEELKLRIEPPAGFWALNWLAVDFSPPSELAVTTVPVGVARNQNGESARASLLQADGEYHEMLEVGDELAVTFPVPEQAPGTKRTVFLHTRGYYKIRIDANGEPDTAALYQVNNERDGAARLAVERLEKLEEDIDAAKWRRLVE